MGYKKKGNIMTRRQIRENIFKILFSFEFASKEEFSEKVELYLENMRNYTEDHEELKVKDEDIVYIRDKSNNIALLLDEIDNIILENSEGWKKERLGKTELAILRLAIYEIKFDEEIPTGVAINEAVELCKVFCKDDAAGFVNGVLAKIA